MIDVVGNTFSVDYLGNCHTVRKQEDVGISSVLPPRYFVIYPDGRGEEIMRYKELEDYIHDAESDPTCAVIQSEVDGDEGVKAITIIKPHHSSPSQVWKKKKEVADIIPVGLRERDFKLCPPVEKKAYGPKLGETILTHSQPNQSSISLPGILELRHVKKYQELTPVVRGEILKIISEYDEFLEKEQENRDVFLNKDLRSRDEIQVAKEIYQMSLEGGQEAVSEGVGNRDTVDQYVRQITPLLPEPIPHARTQPQRAPIEWDKDKLELKDLQYAKSVISNRVFPNYFETKEGEHFLTHTSSLPSPNMRKLADGLAKDALLSSTSDEPCSVEETRSLQNPTDTPTQLNNASSTLPNNNSDNMETKQAKKDEDNKLSENTLLGQMKRDMLPPSGTLGSGDVGVQFVRRHKANTASIANISDLSGSGMEGFVLIPDVLDFGVLKEGYTYSHVVSLKNVGIDTCRFKIKQPPPCTGIKVKYQPCPLAAGMLVKFDVEIFAIAVGVKGGEGVGKVVHDIEIVAETDFFILPVKATIVTANNECLSNEAPSKGTTVISGWSSSREALTRPRKI